MILYSLDRKKRIFLSHLRNGYLLMIIFIVSAILSLWPAALAAATHIPLLFLIYIPYFPVLYALIQTVGDKNHEF